MSVVLHVGLPKTGTTYLQRLMADQRESLRAAGVLYPFLRPGAMFEGAVEVRGSAAKFGLDPAALRGTWAALCERARQHDGTTVLSHEVLAGATPAQVEAALAPLAGLEVHVVVTARDLGRQATAHWQEEVKLGSTDSFADLERTALRCDTGRDVGPDAGGVRPHFWHAQDLGDALRRWGAGLPPQRVHLVVAPPPGAPLEELWRRFAEAAGVPAGALDPTVVTEANPSLGAPEVALLRAVNARLEGRLDVATRHRVVKREWAETVLAARSSAPPRTPATLAPVLSAATAVWVEEVRAAGYAVHGDLADLVPVTAAPGEPAPDQPPDPGDDPDALARRLLAAAAGPERPNRAPGRARPGRLARLLRRAGSA